MFFRYAEVPKSTLSQAAPVAAKSTRQTMTTQNQVHKPTYCSCLNTKKTTKIQIIVSAGQIPVPPF